MTDQLPVARSDQNMISVQDVQTMAGAIAASGLFGLKTPEQAFALMLVAQSEGRHPASAAMDYHVIQGRPSLRADTMLARFQASGGCVEWHVLTDSACAATFAHPSGGEVRIDWDMARAQKAGLAGKDMWSKYPRQMLRARVISEGVRTVLPGILGGMYAPEEEEYFDAQEPRVERNISPSAQAHQADTSEPEQPAEYPPEKFAANIDKWAAQIIGKGKTVESFAGWLASKGVKLSAEQIHELQACADAKSNTGEIK